MNKSKVQGEMRQQLVAQLKITVCATMIGVVLSIGPAAWALGVEAYTGADAATVQGQFKKTAMFGWDMLQFAIVDGQRVSGIRAQDRARAVLHLRPGDHDIVVNYHSCSGFMSGCVQVAIRLGVTLKPNAHYVLGSTRIGDKIQAWIEEEDTHEHVSRILGASGKMERKSEEAQPASPE